MWAPYVWSCVTDFPSLTALLEYLPTYEIRIQSPSPDGKYQIIFNFVKTCHESLEYAYLSSTVVSSRANTVTQPRVGAAEVESLFKEYECCCVMGSVTGHCIPVVWPLHGFRRVLVLWWVLTWNQSWANDHSLSWKGQEFITYIHFQNIHVYRQQLWEQDSPVRWLVNCQTRVAVIIGPEWKIR